MIASKKRPHAGGRGGNGTDKSFFQTLPSWVLWKVKGRFARDYHGPFRTNLLEIKNMTQLFIERGPSTSQA
jgi:hypothetical protein